MSNLIEAEINKYQTRFPLLNREAIINEMFKDGIVREDAGKYVLEELLNAAAYFENVVIVGEDVFSDGNEYDESWEG